MFRYSTFLITVALFLGQIHSNATILQFNLSDYVGTPIPAPSGKLMSIYAHYGDRVESETAFVPEKGFEEQPFTYNYEAGNGFTPNISLTISAAENCEVQYYNEPSWPGVAFLICRDPGKTAKREFYFSFTADPGFATKINSFKVTGYKGSAHRVQWAIRQGSPSGADLETGDAATEVNTTNMTESGLAPSETVATVSTKAYPGTVVLVIEHSEGPDGSFGVDDLNFDQVKAK